MAETTKPNSRQRLADRYRASHPDLNMDDENTDIYGLASDELDSYDKDRAARADVDGKMNKLFGDNPNAAKIFIGWANGQDPVENLLELYGDDLVEALQSQEGKEKFKGALEKWRKGRQADEEHTKKYDENMAQSARNLIAFADANGLSDEQLKPIVDKAWQMGSDIAEGLYTPELLEMVYKAGNYDSAVADAREEGRVTGKNENIRRELRKSKPATNLPPTTGGQGVVGTEAAPAKQKKNTLPMFGNIPVGKK